MEKGLFHELYKRSCELEMGRCPSPALSGFLHGYLSVYSMVRVYPWLEESFGETYEIHERVREIARFIEPLAGNKNLPADVRAGYVVDLMDAYQLYSDLNFLNTALDAAYDILTPWGSDKIVLPCRTPGGSLPPMTNCMVGRNNLDVIHNINLRFREMQPPVIASPSTVLLSRISY